jgi:hypothetical protein
MLNTQVHNTKIDPNDDDEEMKDLLNAPGPIVARD